MGFCRAASGNLPPDTRHSRNGHRTPGASLQSNWTSEARAEPLQPCRSRCRLGGRKTHFRTRMALGFAGRALRRFAGLRKDGTVGGIALDAESGAEIRELDIPATIDPNTRSGCWMPGNNSIAISDVRNGTPNLWTIPMVTSPKPIEVTNFTSGVIWDCHYSPDGVDRHCARYKSKRCGTLHDSAVVDGRGSLQLEIQSPEIFRRVLQFQPEFPTGASFVTAPD